MRWEAYKRQCEQPDVLSRWVIEQTAELLDDDLRGRVLAELDAEPLPRPSGHVGDRRADMFLINDLGDVALSISVAVGQAVRGGRCTSAVTTLGVRRFDAVWRNYAAYVAAGLANV